MSKRRESARRVPWPKRTRRFLRAYAILGLLAVLGCVPLGLALRFGAWAGRVAYRLLGGERRRSLAHLALAFPEKSEAEREAIARRMFETLGMSAMELAQLRRIDRDLESYVELSEETLRQLERVPTGSGAVMVTGHIGNWELLLRRCLRAGLDAYAVGKESHDPRFTRLMEKVRGRDRVIWRGAEGASRQMLQVFRRNGYLALLMDQDTKVQGVFVPFFGRLAHTPRAPADLALRMGAGVAAIFIHRRPEGGHEITVREIPVPDTRGEEAVVALTAAMTEAIEEEIRRHPHEWVWMHRRWATRPAPDSGVNDRSDEAVGQSA